MDFRNLNADLNFWFENFTPGRPQGMIGTTIHHATTNTDPANLVGIWRRTGASAHYYVRENVIAQYVHDSDRAWHAVSGNMRTIGIEHANNIFAEPWTVSDETINYGSRLVGAIHVFYKFGRPTWMQNVFPHKYWVSTRCPGALGDIQRDAYMNLAGTWYDKMMDGDFGEDASPGVSIPVPVAPPTDPLSDDIFGVESVKEYQRLRGLTVDGAFGTDCVRDLQGLLKTGFDDGWIDGQKKSLMDEWAPAVTAYNSGKGGSPTVSALQSYTGANPDGIWGQQTSNRFQAWIRLGLK